MKKTQPNLCGIGSLLRKNISLGQIIGYAVSNIVGLTVILSGILFYCDSHHQRKTEDKFFSEDYIVISKKVDGVNLKPLSFSQKEIEDLKQQDWVKKIGNFTSANYSVSATVNMGGKGLSSYLFFESVPDDFFDKLPQGWDFTPGQNFVPIVLNKDYLALYNFGFALPQGLPQLSEEMIATVPLKLMISGKDGLAQTFDANVVGFSSRLNTIAVPQEFMDYANKKFATETTTDPSRLIIRIDRLNPGNSEKYLKSKGYEIAGDKESESKVSEFMGIVSGVMSAVGVVISALALFILLLSISLLIQKNRTMIRNLFLLGYSPFNVGRYYRNRLIIVNFCICALSIGFTFICRLIWHKPLIALGLGNGNVLFTLGAAIVFFLLISVINILVINRQMKNIWQNN